MNQQNLFGGAPEGDAEEKKELQSAAEPKSKARAKPIQNSEAYTVVFFDTETTGLGETDRLCQLAYKVDGVEFESLYNPQTPIDPYASEITGITDEMVADQEVFVGSQAHKDLGALADAPESVFVAHNAPFDIGMVAKEEITVSRAIDTLKVARVVDDGKAESYKQEYLWKYYDLQVDDARAHDALGDVRVLEALFNRLAELMAQDDRFGDDILAEMLRITQEPILYKIFPFGKYKGKEIAEVVKEDAGYLEWLFSQKRSDAANGRKDPDWIHTLGHYLGKKID